MFEAVLHCQLRIAIALCAIHGLQKEMLKLERLESFRLKAVLRKDQLQFVPTCEHLIGASFGTDTDPIESVWRALGSVGLNGDLEPPSVQRFDQWRIELQKRFSASADDESLRAR